MMRGEDESEGESEYEYEDEGGDETVRGKDGRECSVQQPPVGAAGSPSQPEPPLALMLRNRHPGGERGVTYDCDHTGDEKET